MYLIGNNCRIHSATGVIQYLFWQMHLMSTLYVRDWSLVILFALIPLIVNEIIKVFIRVKNKEE